MVLLIISFGLARLALLMIKTIILYLVTYLFSYKTTYIVCFHKICDMHKCKFINLGGLIKWINYMWPSKSVVEVVLAHNYMSNVEDLLSSSI